MGNEGRQYKPGDPCDEALRWRYPALRACINMGIIEDTTGDVDKLVGRMTPSERAEIRAADRAKIAHLAPPPPTEVAAEEAPEYEDEEAPADLELKSQVACADCDKVYDSENGLKKHRSRAHRE